ncbi:MAG: hypothetical protein ACT4NP_09060 [Pseudonocardiales bacterium]
MLLCHDDSHDVLGSAVDGEADQYIQHPFQLSVRVQVQGGGQQCVPTVLLGP